MLPIDKRELIRLRREEAVSCFHYGQFHAATLTACSGIEMLLKTLYEELESKLSLKDPSRARELKDHIRHMTDNGDPQALWGLGRWIEFYSDFDILGDLVKQFKYRLSELNITSLWLANKEWNKCKHRFISADADTAKYVGDCLNSFLDETQVAPADENTRLGTVSEFGQRWLEDWERPIRQWLVQHRASPQATLLEALPKLLALIVHLIHDENVPYGDKTQLMIAANYVLSSVDLMPEETLDARGLVDDSAVLVFTVAWLLRHRNVAEDHLRRHWRGDQDIVATVERLLNHIHENSHALFVESRFQYGAGLIWASIRRVEDEGPQALWKNYWKEAY